MIVRGLRRQSTVWAAALTLAALPAASAGAQELGGQRAPAAEQGDRARLERQVRQRIARVVQQRLRLSDGQMARLQQTNRAYEGRRRELVRQEREVRMAIRAQLAADSAADQKSVGALIDRAIQLQRQRLDLVESEQRELAQFLTPVQRARYLDLQDKLRRRVEELRRGDEAGAARPGGSSMRRQRFRG